MSLLERLVDGFINAKDPTMAVLIFVVIIAVVLYLLLGLASKPVEGFQILVTDLADDNRSQNQNALRLTEDLGLMRVQLARLEHTVENLQLELKDAKTERRELLEKLDMVTEELASVCRQLEAANRKLKEKDDQILALEQIKDARIVELETHAEALREKVDSLSQQIVLLQNVADPDGEPKS